MNEKVLAFVIDGKVARIMRLDEETASIILSSPEIVDITNIQITESWNYDNQTGFYVDIDGEQLVMPLD